jgi:GNAT superfamily N-acetyltransferase
MKQRFGLTHWYPPYPIETMRRNAEELHVYGVHRPNEAGSVDVVGTFTVGTHGWKYDDRLWTNPGDRPLYLGKLAIRPQLQGQGIGAWCMQKVEELAGEWNCQAVRFDAIAGHIPLIRFYKNLGYCERGTQIIRDWRGLEWEIMYLEKLLAAA